MKLVRLAGITLYTTHEDWMNQWDIRDDEVSLSFLGTKREEKSCDLYVSASIRTDYPKIESGYAIVSKSLRIRCEKSIEFLANLISVQARCRRKIKSFSPPVVFLIENDDELLHLSSAVKGINNAPILQNGHAMPSPKDLSVLARLTDRKEGVALIAEAINHSTASGKYRDFIRLFENAFRLKPSNLGKKLMQFLNPKMGYSRSEIEAWLSVRDGINHADMMKCDKVILESDVSPFINRMEQAAFDILYNKAEWSSSSKTRREVWSSNAMTTDSAGRTVSVEGVKFSIQILDAYGVYSGLGPVIPTEQFPSCWWPRPER